MNARLSRRARIYTLLSLGALSCIAVSSGGALGSGGANYAALAAQPGAPEPTAGGTLIFAASTEVSSWLPTDLRQTNGGEDRAALLYDTLLIPTVEGNWNPNIADMSSEDGLTWTMTLKEGILFSDGTSLDAEAVKFNVELHQNADLGSSLVAAVSTIIGMNVVDAHTLEFVLETANGSFPMTFTTLPGMIVSPTAYQADPEGFGTTPVGAGPFVLESWTRDSIARFVRNANYWDQPKPYLDAVEVRLIPDHSTRGQAVASGEVHIATGDAAAQAAISETDGSARDGFAIFTQTNEGAAYVTANWDREPWDDVRLREAMALAFDPAVANESLLQGAWPEEEFSCPPFAPGQLICLEDSWPAHDPDEARRLVEEVVAEGTSLGTYGLLAPSTFTAHAEYIQQQLGDIGIDVTLEILPVPEYVTRMTSGDFDLVWLGLPPGTTNFYYRNHHSAQRFLQKGTPEAELDMHMEQALAALDAEERASHAQWVQEYNTEHFMAIFFAPFIGGLVGSADVELGGRYPGGGNIVPQDVWLDR